ncbi:MAG TPA: GvpL/GvpF family gas vesicle protein [Candidatus Limnocylindria bacterium]|nr:GvpL/GvpF family gas vesicle protein [Candidatus Limnocylindria bacterium]
MSLVYVYAIAPSGCAGPADLRGIGDGRVQGIPEGGLVAFASEVPESEFAEAPLNANLADMEWLTPRAVRHQEVNAALAAGCDPLVPLSFGAVFRDAAGVTRMLRERATELAPRFEALRGKAEWIAVIRRDRHRALVAVESGSDALRALRREIDAAGPGRGHLIARRLDETKRQELRAGDANAVAAATEAFAGTGARLFREPLVEDAAGTMLARFSVLAARDGGAALERAGAFITNAWGARGYSIELSGPWPAYRFSTVNAS